MALLLRSTWLIPLALLAACSGPLGVVDGSRPNAPFAPLPPGSPAPPGGGDAICALPLPPEGCQDTPVLPLPPRG